MGVTKTMKFITQCIISAFATMAIALSAIASNFEEGFVGLDNGQSLHYIAQGQQGNKPLMLFIHGAPERAEVWKDYMEAFSDDYYTVAYTSRGYAPSSIPTEVEAYTVTNLAADALAVANAFGYETFTVVGHDWGGATAWRAAIAFPNNVEKLVVISNPHPLMYARAYHESAEQKALIDAYIPLARDGIAPWTREGTLANNLEHFKHYVYTDKAKSSLDWTTGLLLEETWLENDGASIDAIYNHYKALDWPLTTLATCNPAPTFSLTAHQPALVFYGDNDRFGSADAYTLPNNDCTPNAKYVKIRKGDHFIHHTHKRRLIHKMKRFLRNN